MSSVAPDSKTVEQIEKENVVKNLKARGYPQLNASQVFEALRLKLAPQAELLLLKKQELVPEPEALEAELDADDDHDALLVSPASSSADSRVYFEVPDKNAVVIKPLDLQMNEVTYDVNAFDKDGTHFHKTVNENADLNVSKILSDKKFNGKDIFLPLIVTNRFGLRHIVFLFKSVEDECVYLFDSRKTVTSALDNMVIVGLNVELNRIGRGTQSMFDGTSCGYQVIESIRFLVENKNDDVFPLENALHCVAELPQSEIDLLLKRPSLQEKIFGWLRSSNVAKGYKISGMLEVIALASIAGYVTYAYLPMALGALSTGLAITILSVGMAAAIVLTFLVASYLFNAMFMSSNNGKGSEPVASRSDAAAVTPSVSPPASLPASPATSPPVSPVGGRSRVNSRGDDHGRRSVHEI